MAGIISGVDVQLAIDQWADAIITAAIIAGKSKHIGMEYKGNIIAPNGDFFDMPKRMFDWVVMNPPFTPMKKGYLNTAWKV